MSLDALFARAEALGLRPVVGPEHGTKEWQAYLWSNDAPGPVSIAATPSEALSAALAAYTQERERENAAEAFALLREWHSALPTEDYDAKVCAFMLRIDGPAQGMEGREKAEPLWTCQSCGHQCWNETHAAHADWHGDCFGNANGSNGLHGADCDRPKP